jgi:hypothetical protein
VTSKENADIASKATDHAALLFKQGIADGIEAENAAIEAARSAITHLQSRADTIAKLTVLTKALGGTSTSAPTNEKTHD